MKAFQVLLALSGILIIIGIYVIFPPLPASGNLTGNIPAGNYFWRVSFSVEKAGHISGTFSVTSGDSITLYVLNANQFDGYRNGQSTGNLFTTSGRSGSFSASVSSPGSYYLVLEHAGNNTAQEVQVSYLFDGMNPVILGAGAGLISAGVALGLLGRYRKRKTIAPRSVTDVTMFDQPKA